MLYILTSARCVPCVAIMHCLAQSLPLVTMYRTLRTNGSGRILLSLPALQFSIIRSTPRVCTQNCAVAHICSLSRTRPVQRTTSQAIFSSPNHRLHRRYLVPQRSYASSTSSDDSPNIVYATIGICCAVFVYNVHAKAEYTERKNPVPAVFVQKNLVCSTDNWRAGRWWTFLTSSVNHVDLIHLGANMLTLYSLGPIFVATVGARGYLLTWIGSSISCSGVNLWWENQGRMIPLVAAFLRRQNTSLQPVERKYGGAVGASGAVLGLTTALTLAAPNMQLMIFPLPIPFRLWVINSLIAILSGSLLITNSLPSLGHAGHLGGMAGGLACGLILLRR